MPGTVWSEDVAEIAWEHVLEVNMRKLLDKIEYTRQLDLRKPWNADAPRRKRRTPSIPWHGNAWIRRHRHPAPLQPLVDALASVGGMLDFANASLRPRNNGLTLRVMLSECQSPKGLRTQHPVIIKRFAEVVRVRALKFDEVHIFVFR
jgi:hypothetical protein